ncbi:MAG: radical SAM protein [Bacteroidales bacterium]|jgi:organic radical activating enzyme|nr:radical SAM protein [Bacteroidales bacterium]
MVLISDKIKRFIDCHVPVTACNLRCPYCYIVQSGQFSDELPVFEYPPEHIARALSKKRLGGTCCLNFCGAGETLLPPELPGIIGVLLDEGHYVMVVTNGTISRRFDEILRLPKRLLKRLFVKFSFQYFELLRLNLMDMFFGNIQKIKNAGSSFSLELTPCDELIPYKEDIKKTCRENVGALCHVTVARDSTKKELPILTSYTREKYKEIWSDFHSAMFEYKMSVFNIKQTGFCYAGDMTSVLNIATGDLTQCYKGKRIGNIYHDIKKPINFEPIGKNCPEAHCYNAHAFLTFGAIPELNAHTPTYADMRNRICVDGMEWLTSKMKAFMSTKLVVRKGRSK